MPANRSAQNLGRRVIDFLAGSVLDAISLENVFLDGREISLPVAFKASPNADYTVGFKVDLKGDMSFQQGVKTIIMVNMGGSALVYQDGRNIGAIDHGHTFLPVDVRRGPSSFRLIANSRGLFGENPTSFRLDHIRFLNLDWNKFKAALLLLNLYDLMLSTKDKDLESSLFEAMDKFLAPYRADLSLKNVIGASWLSESVKDNLPTASRISSDYGYLADLYVSGIKDLPAGEYHSSSDFIDVTDLKPACLKHKNHRTFLFGHAHIDAAWLWPYSETRKKVRKTFLNMLELMDQGNEFSFAQSSTLFYEWFKELEPESFERIVEMVRKNRWIPVGGMFVESDTNILPSETLARQFLTGQKFFKEHFGKISRIGWLPDTFGFSGQLPQIMLKSGLKVFTTHKPIWNDTTPFPYHAFRWSGIDGSIIPTEIMVHSYDSYLRYFSVLDGMEKFMHGPEVPVIIAYGLGDGGGGPSIPILTWLDHINLLPGMEDAVQAPDEADYVEALTGIRDLPLFQGEIYLQRHRGVYTTNSIIKKRVADMDRRLRNIEITLSLIALQTGRMIPVSVINELEAHWKVLLAACFHDLLPGSANTEAYQEVFGDMDRSIRELERIQNDLLEGYGRDESSLIALNTTQWEYNFHDSGKKAEILIPPLSIISVNEKRWAEEISFEEDEIGISVILKEKTYRFSRKDGSISVISGKGNILLENMNRVRLFSDEPGEFDAWEIVRDTVSEKYEIPERDCRITYSLHGKKNIKVEHTFDDGSILVQTFEFGDGGKTVRVQSMVKPFYRLRIFKAFFPYPDAADEVQCSIPFGWVRRSRENTAKEMFEFPCMNWMTVGTPDKRYTIISDHIHGYGHYGNVLTLTLARFPVFPNPYSDGDTANVEYTLWIGNESPESGDFHAKVRQILERPLIRRAGKDRVENRPDVISPIKVTGGGITMESIYPSSDGTSIIIRLLENSGRESECSVTTKEDYDLLETNILEEPVTHIAVKSGGKITFRPFEIKTFRIQLKGAQ
ncbi:MAG: glycosyl hydrolase-related protein [Candidatus Thermoplasmatota archaeon]|nr:glycosyl hydrolase-related protein [Candidatus Thermoplasmatota archaeon]